MTHRAVEAGLVAGLPGHGAAFARLVVANVKMGDVS